MRIERIFLIVALRRKQPAKAVSLLKLEPKVSSFPVLESVITDSSAHATGKILSIFCFLYVNKGLRRIVAEDGSSLVRRVSCYYGKFFLFLILGEDATGFTREKYNNEIIF